MCSIKVRTKLYKVAHNTWSRTVWERKFWSACVVIMHVRAKSCVISSLNPKRMCMSRNKELFSTRVMVPLKLNQPCCALPFWSGSDDDRHLAIVLDLIRTIIASFTHKMWVFRTHQLLESLNLYQLLERSVYTSDLLILGLRMVGGGVWKQHNRLTSMFKSSAVVMHGNASILLWFLSYKSIHVQLQRH